VKRQDDRTGSSDTFPLQDRTIMLLINLAAVRPLLADADDIAVNIGACHSGYRRKM